MDMPMIAALNRKLSTDCASTSLRIGRVITLTSDVCAATAIVKEKDRAAYSSLVEQRRFEPGRVWMIGNSPKSDINPALECGLNAVFVPHARTWGLEKEEIREGVGRLIIVERFADLRRHF